MEIFDYFFCNFSINQGEVIVKSNWKILNKCQTMGKSLIAIMHGLRKLLHMNFLMIKTNQITLVTIILAYL